MDTDVLVVGAGPVGLVAACELARRGVRMRIVDTLAAPTTESRAILVHARSLEMAGADRPAGCAVPGGAAVLVADRPDAVAGYDAVVADPDHTVATRYGFEHGGRAVIRPDGYLGLVGALDADVDGYFAQLTG